MEQVLLYFQPYMDILAPYLPKNCGISHIYQTLSVLILVFFLTSLYLKIRRLPPGPYGIPFIGYRPMFKTDNRAETIKELSKFYKSDVICITVFGRNIVFLNSYQLVRECFMRRADISDRVRAAFFNILDDDYVGIIGISGSAWKDHRRFSLYMMRDFGMGKVRAEEMIQHETEMVMTEFHKIKGLPFNPTQLVNSAVSNIICSMIYGQRYEYSDEEFLQSLKNMNDLIINFGGSRIWMLLKSKIGKYIFKNYLDGILYYYNGFAKFARARIQEHIERYDGQVNDLIDAYLKECYDEKKPDSFSVKNLPYLITDMFVAGSETTFTTLRWALLYMGHYPEIQERVYQELKNVLGDRLPTMNDKKSTPYADATLSEIQRMNSLLPLGLFHTNLEKNFQIKEHTIPKGTPVAANIHAVHRDPTIWRKPYEFNPEANFMEEGKVVNQEFLMPFGIGRRSCAGEALARMELYIFFTSWLLNFEVQLVEGEDKPSLKGIHRGVWQPEQQFEIRLIPRKQAEE